MASNPLTDIDFFAAIIKFGSMAAAAKELGVTPPVVTRQLAQLEKRLGVRLLNRTTRKISLTSDGELYLTEGVRIIEEMKSLEGRLGNGTKQPRGVIRIAATLGFGRTHIAPVLSDFIRQYPLIDIQLHLTNRAINLVDQGFDLMLRFGELDDSRLTARLLAKNNRIVCAAPSYLQANGIPTHPRDLGKHNCIFIREADETFGTWHLCNADKVETIKVRSNLTTNDGSSGLGWGLDGQGLLIRSAWEIAPLLRAQKLIQVLPEWKPLSADIYLIFQAGKQTPAKLRVLIDYLLDTFKAKRASTKDVLSGW